MNQPQALQALSFAHLFLRGNLETAGCPYDGVYRGSSRCDGCEQDLECAWVTRSDRLAPPEELPMADLVGELRLARSFVMARVRSSGHRRRGCACPACGWLRRTRPLTEA